MALPGNGIFVVRGEMSTLMTAMKRGAARWSSTSYQDEEQDGLMKQFIELKQILNQIEDLKLIDPNVYLGPFLDVIRAEETTGAVTSLALSAINKFLSYGLIDPTHATLAATVENIADAVTHARFMATDQASDGVTLMRVVEAFHTLMRSPEGSALTNESVCEVMLGCFKICFEPRLNELLRRTAEQALKDMVLLLFMRLPQFSEEHHPSGLLKKFKLTSSGSIEKNSGNTKQQKRKTKSGTTTNKQQQQQRNGTRSNVTRAQNIKSEQTVSGQTDNPESPHLNVQNLKQPPLATTPATPGGIIVDMQGKITQTPVTTNSNVVGVDGSDGVEDESNSAVPIDELNMVQNEDDKEKQNENISDNAEDDSHVEDGRNIGADSGDIKDLQEDKSVNASGIGGVDNGEYINSVGVRFTQQNSMDADGLNPLLPYGLPCIQELFRFLILLCNPLDKQNTDIMTHMGLSLLTVAFEVGADNIGKYDTLLALVKDEMCRNLFSLLNSERLTIFAADLQLCFLLFESLRSHLKFQLEYYLTKLSEIIISENPRTPYEFKELALDNLLQLWRIPGFIAELYINYDCNLYCTDMFENLTELLSKNTLSATNSVYSIHTLSLDALISVIESIEKNCLASKTSGCNTVIINSTVSRHSRNNSSLEGITIIGGDGNNTTITAIANNSGNSTLNNTITNTDMITANLSSENTLTDINSRTNETESDTGSNGNVENISTFIKNYDNYKKLYSKSSSNQLTTSSIATKISKEELINIKNKKRILAQGTELFNQRPDKGIQYLQENGILNPKLDPREVALFLRENPGLDKKMIGEFISKKKNVESKILENFVESFDFANLRIDLALRLYLETFRLPGEAPLIFLVMEHFADHWHKCNGEPFANTDAAFRLAYAIIMLNMDQHNHNAKRLNVPMTPEDFLKNLRGLNGNKDFDQDMLLNVYNSIKNEEIVMPAEQTGLVRENYLWKVLLRRGVGKEGQYLHVQDSSYDKELFTIVWGPSLAALSFMFDKSTENGYQKSLVGFTKCAGISAFYSLHEHFDALILTLCKFTTLLNVQLDTMNEITFTVNFGLNYKAQSATKTVFKLIHDYGDCLRESWKNVLDVIIQLFRLKLLPKQLIEVEDFCEPNGKVQLILEKQSSQKSDVGLFSSLYSYLSSDGQRQPTYEEQEIIKSAKKCIRECQIDQIISETKFIQYDSLQELFKSIMNLIKSPNGHKSIGLVYAEDITVFWLEFLVKIIIQNRDRIMPLWPTCRDQIYLLLMGGSSCGYDYLLNRTTVALLKLAIYLMRNEELCPIVLQSLKMLLMLKPNVIYRISKQISIGIYELLKTSAQNIHTETDWQIIFTILECVGAGALPPEFDDGLQIAGTKSDGALSSEEDSGLPDRGYISDSEVINANSKCDTNSSLNNAAPYLSPSGENWILVNKDSEISVSASRPQSPIGSSLVYPCKLLDHLPFALFKCWDSLSFIVRNVAHITPYNFECCVRCIRTFVEAVLDGGIKARRKLAFGGKSHSRKKSNSSSTKRESSSSSKGKKRTGGEENSNSDSEDDELSQRYETLAIQLLDLMYTLYTRTAQIFRWWAEEGCTVPQCSALWAQGWCPILQGIARLAVDRRREVRTYAISCLQQRALLVHDLQTLTGAEWASCFKQVLFPLLNELLPESSSISNLDPILLEESRIRTATIMSKVFLHHLTPLIELPTFNDLWLEILDYIEKFMKVGSDMLYEQMLEILKNMLLVMHSVRVFHCNDGQTRTPLWELTWKRIGEFLPNLKEELFRDDANRVNVAVAGTTTVVSPQQIQLQQSFLQSQTIQSVADPTSANFMGNNANESGTQQKEGLGANTTGMMGVGGSNSIILQPPLDICSGKQLIIGQASSSPQHNIPVLIPQATTGLQQQQQQQQQYQNNYYQSYERHANSVTTENIISSSPPASVISQMMQHTNHHKDGHLPDLVTDTSISTQNRISNVEISPNSTPQKDPLPTAYMNKLPETSMFNYQQLQHQQQQQQVQDIIQLMAQQKLDGNNSVNENSSISVNSSSSPIPVPSTNLYTSSPSSSFQQNQFYTINNSYSQSPYSSQSSNFQQQQQQRQQQQQQYSSIVSSNSSNDLHEDLQPRVPISHLITGNQYPSLKKQPPPSIVQSFPPVYVQPQQPQSGSDIYSDYVQNPYNLTLQQHQQQQQQQFQNSPVLNNNNNQTSTTITTSSLSSGSVENDTMTTETVAITKAIETSNITNVATTTTTITTNTTTTNTTQVLGVSNVFQSANYFGGIDKNSIPPGSEMLFGQP